MFQGFSSEASWIVALQGRIHEAYLYDCRSSEQAVDLPIEKKTLSP